MSSNLLIKDRKSKTFKRGDIALIIPDPDYSRTNVKAMIMAAVKGSRSNTFTVTFLPLLEPYLNLLKEENGDNPDYWQEAPKLINATNLQFIKIDKPSRQLDPWEKKIYDQMVVLL